MLDVSNGSNPQSETLAVYTLLSRLRADWRGALILCCGLSPQGSAVALAANAAGATCLAIEPDPALCRAAMRAGACDFFVNTVDEALRVLKNEIRQRRPLAVALELNLAAALRELLDRGVLPEVFTTALVSASENDVAGLVTGAASLRSQGAAILDLNGTLSSLATVAVVQPFLGQEDPISQTFSFETAAALKAFDRRLQQLIPNADPRRSWLLAAPRLFPRDRPYRRSVALTPPEFAVLGIDPSAPNRFSSLLK